ncbi:MAG: hypothetical protein ACWA42_03940 [Lutibacter sp.]
MKFLLALLFIITSSCNATYKGYQFQKKIPFQIQSTEITDWVGGQPGIKGVKIRIQVVPTETVLKSVYYKNRRTVLDKNKHSNTYIGIIQTTDETFDYNLNRNPKKEFGNSIKNKDDSIPFNLNENEIVISYYYKSKLYFYKYTYK